MLVPFASWCSTRSSRPADYSLAGAAEPARGLYLKGIVHFWNRVDFGRKLWNSLLISGSVAVLRRSCSVLNAYALGIGRVRGRLWILVVFLVANTLPQEALVYPLYYLAKAGRPLRHQARGDHHLHGDPERLRHLPALLGAQPVPARDPGGGGDRRRRASGGRCGRSWCRSAGRRWPSC